MEKEKTTEKRMFILVPYNLSDIQKGIQALHAVAEYGHKMLTVHFDDPWGQKYKDWVTNWKTVIVLNGGTTNGEWDFDVHRGPIGSLQRYIRDLEKLGVMFSVFQEPDLNNAETAVAFVLDMENDSHIIGYLKQMGLA